MTETKFTPGPWVAWCEEGQTKSGKFRYSVCHHVGDIDSKDHKCVSEVYGETEEDAEANAHITAAAPDLYAALVEMLTVHGSAGPVSALAIAALAKARGES